MAEFIVPDDAAFAKAKRKRTTPYAVSARFEKRTGRIKVRLDTGIEFAFDPSRAKGLAEAKADDFAGVAVQGAGSTLHFPRLDADYSVAGLLEGFLGSMEWTRREARAAASRRNGLSGGRPRKAAA